MAGNSRNTKWWAMKRAKEQKIKRKTKQAVGNQPGGHKNEREIAEGESEKVGHPQTVSNKPVLQESKTDQVKSTGEVSQTLSKQARKRKLKRQKEKQQKLAEKKAAKPKADAGSKLGKDNAAEQKDAPSKKRPMQLSKEEATEKKGAPSKKKSKQLGKDGAAEQKAVPPKKKPKQLGKDKETERKEVPSKKGPKKFNKKKSVGKRQEAAGDIISPPGTKHNISDMVQRDEGLSPQDDVRPESKKMLKRKDRTEHHMSKKKRKDDDDASADAGHGNMEQEKGATQRDNKQNNPAAVGGVDTNWLNLMKTIPHGPHVRKELKKNLKGTVSSPEQPRKPEIWFDDVDPILLNDSGAEGVLSPTSSLAPPVGPEKAEEATGVKGLTKYIALDCEMVGIGPGGRESMVARVSLVNQLGSCIYDKYVTPQEDVTHYRTSVSGIEPANLKNAEDFTKVQEEVSNILKGRILVGHALHNDLKVLFLNHPKSMMRDTSTYKPFRELCQGHRPSLKKLCELILKVKIQEAEHNSVEDAQAVMNLFLRYRKKWEKEAQKMLKRRKKKTRTEAVDIDSS